MRSRKRWCLGANGVNLLRSEGVTGFDVPAEALEERESPPLTLDDLIDLHFLLESDGWQGWFAGKVVRSRMRRVTRTPGRRRTATWMVPREGEP